MVMVRRYHTENAYTITHFCAKIMLYQRRRMNKIFFLWLINFSTETIKSAPMLGHEEKQMKVDKTQIVLELLNVPCHFVKEK